jgi:dipeptidyl aminopeptidase/acylaminoacyl peptidase
MKKSDYVHYLVSLRSFRAAALVAMVIAPFVVPSLARAEGLNGRIALGLGNPSGAIVSVNPDGTNQVKLAPASTKNMTPSWSPGGQFIVFVSLRDGTDNAEIWRMKADGSGQTRLTFYDSYDTDPSFSPDGTQILFTRLDGASPRPYVMGVDGSNQHAIADLKGMYTVWSPDGTKIAYSWAGPNGATDIWVANADGTSPVDITATADTGFDGNPRWSPDGTKIIYRNNGVVYSVNADGTNSPEQFTFAGVHPPLPTFSPDGKAIAYSGSNEAWVLYEDGSRKKIIDNVANVAFVAWQPVWVEFSAISGSVISYGDAVNLTAHLHWGDTTDNDLVSLYKKSASGDVLVDTHTVDANGETTFVVHPTRKTTYIAKWTGDSSHGASTTPKAALIQVRVEALVHLSHAYGRDGKYRLYRLGHLVPITGTVLPKHAHKDIQFLVERLDGKHRWRYVTQGIFSLGKRGVVTVVFRSDRIGRYRVRTSFRGDKDHLADVSPWALFKITS